jgi:hypothetical protein
VEDCTPQNPEEKKSRQAKRGLQEREKSRTKKTQQREATRLFQRVGIVQSIRYPESYQSNIYGLAN